MATPANDEPRCEGTVRLPGYEAQQHDSGVLHSKEKLVAALRDFRAIIDPSVISVRPCETETESWGYRCSCTFQIVHVGGYWRYAMRHQQEPVPIGMDTFPIATHRIQAAMKCFLSLVNSSIFSTIRNQLTSVSFASSWDDIPSSDCFITMHYNQPLNELPWKNEANKLCSMLNVSKVTGRSKKRMVSVTQANQVDKNFISDSLWLHRNEKGSIYRVSFEQDFTCRESVRVDYHKPDSAFFHPNANVMLQALQWMIHRLELITAKEPCRLLEMYCGCGAHTVALASSGLLELIVAVELDQRLIDSCIANCRRNGCYEVDAIRTPVYVFQGDAGEWARKSRRSKSRHLAPLSDPLGRSSWYAADYHILLVDPPRMGLDDKVCNMAIEGNFQHVLYISCGKHALQRDLQRLNAHFEVVDCTLLDLFPRTDSVESLIHLKKKSKNAVVI